MTTVKERTEDETVFGENVFVYCDQHLRPHLTGWCTVSTGHKFLLEATNHEDAYRECEAKGYKIYKG